MGVNQGGEARSFTRGPSRKDVEAYLERAGEALWQKELTVLSGEPFHVAGEAAEKAGWFLGRNALMQATAATKLAESTGLPVEEANLLIQASFFPSAMIRVQIETLGKQGRKLGDMSSQERTDFDEQGRDVLVAKGINPRAAKIALAAHNTDFYRELWGGTIQPQNEEEEQDLKLTRYLLYIHNTVRTKKVELEPGKVWHETDIIPWQERLDLGGKDYRTIANETKEGIPHFVIEGQLTESIENELQARMIEASGELPDGILPWQYLKQRILDDVAGNLLPQVPSKKRSS